MKKILTTIILLFVTSVSADVPAEQVDEVNHLLDFISKSDCVIERNGTKHSTLEAIEHILKKYDHFRDDIDSTEAFIEYSASRSTLSGDYYTVECPDMKKTKTKDWLLSELKRYRSKQGEAR